MNGFQGPGVWLGLPKDSTDLTGAEDGPAR